ncbi:Uncharacterized protein HZ326_2320 [Fusarium oxysporum f. sp. albedinis]|nr:Uncharacterized protein HZ326_2320 [Fusarium oxysporum f. sp. albedinis]
MPFCSHVVGKSTLENRYRPMSKTTEARVVSLQRSRTVNEQAFESFAIYPESPQAVITTSRRASRTRSQGREASSDKSWRERASTPPQNKQIREIMTTASGDLHEQLSPFSDAPLGLFKKCFSGCTNLGSCQITGIRCSISYLVPSCLETPQYCTDLPRPSFR